MNLKIAVIAVSIIALLGLVFLWTDRQTSATPTINPLPQTSPTPPPTPTITVDQNTNLSKETNQLTPADFSADYQSLKQQANQL